MQKRLDIAENATAIEDSTLLTLLFNTGLRISETISLTKNNIIERDMSGDGEEVRVRWLKVVGKGGKERAVPLNA